MNNRRTTPQNNANDNNAKLLVTELWKGSFSWADNGKQQIIYIPLSGPSMTPTLLEFDLLEVQPYDEQSVQIGDVVAFQLSRGAKHIVHRVLRVGPQGIRTLGDNNLYEDPLDLETEALTGRVIAVWRGQKRRNVYGGQAGRLIARTVRITRTLDRSISRVLRSTYHALARRGTLRAVLPRSLRPRVVRFGNTEHPSMMLLFLGRVIGRYDVDRRQWVIRRPYKLIVEEDLLPVLKDHKAE